MQVTPHSDLLAQLQYEVNRRRTFAIISHPDAGKTTLTEKLLLYAGAVNEAGSVRAGKNQRSATSDWMDMERQRGISITSTVLQFEYQDHVFNLLDTPGHQDFSEDTYRTLMAVDSAVMVLDSVKGIESQTRKLFEVCRQRHLPIITFINKMDNYGRDPFTLMDEIEKVLSLHVVPMNWPIGSGSEFQGVYDLRRRQVLLFQRTARGKHRAPVQVSDLYDPALEGILGERAVAKLREDVELLLGAGTSFNVADFLKGTMTPIFFGSALNNFGIDPFLESLIQLAPAPRPRESRNGLVEPTSAAFSGIIFKIQANMDPQHRDSMAFLRVCSGRFVKDMSVYHPRLKRKISMSRPHRLFARDRETLDVAYPGDVIGLSNPGIFTIGDTVSAGEMVEYAPMPRFQPECFAVLRNSSIEKHKQFHKGLEQLQQEGVVQVFQGLSYTRSEPILGAVGKLQFDVVLARLAAEYNVAATLEHLPYVTACWIEGEELEAKKVRWSLGSLRAFDQDHRQLVLVESMWEIKFQVKEHPGLRFVNIAGNPLDVVT